MGNNYPIFAPSKGGKLQPRITKALPDDGQDVDVTSMVNGLDFYTFDVGAVKNTLTIAAVGNGL